MVLIIPGHDEIFHRPDDPEHTKATRYSHGNGHGDVGPGKTLVIAAEMMQVVLRRRSICCAGLSSTNIEPWSHRGSDTIRLLRAR